MERLTEYATWIIYAIAAISGGLGGCAIAGHHILRGEPARSSFVVAYTLIGVVFGILFFATSSMMGFITITVHELIAKSMMIGALGSLSLASMNLSARFILRRLGIEVQVQVKRRGEF